MHTAAPSSKLAYICEHVMRMKPGECLKLDRRELSDVPSYEHNGATFAPADRVLGNIVGSAYTHSYRIDPATGDVTFERHEYTGEVRYRSPDRR